MREKIRTRIAALHALAAKTRATEQKIMDQAEARLDVIAGRLEEIRPHTLTDDDLADEYRRLILERGKLHLVVSHARRELGPAQHGAAS